MTHRPDLAELKDGQQIVQTGEKGWGVRGKRVLQQAMRVQFETELVPGQGHFGPDALPGDARWRRGESVSRESARNAMTGIEAAAHSQLVFQKRS